MNKLITCIVFLILFDSVSGQVMTPAEYIEQYKDLAVLEMKRTGVPAAIKLAQGILESGCGNSELARKSNNHFGIKCKTGWTGPSVAHNDDERGECFRAYNTVDESYRDHSDFLKNSGRYASLFDLNPDDYKGWAFGLKKAGYATNPRYAYILIENIEKFDLNQYSIAGMLQGVDAGEYRRMSRVAMQSHETTMQQQAGIPVNDFCVFRINRLKAVKVAAGTSLLVVADKFNVRLNKLAEWNELNQYGMADKDMVLFLEKKRQSGELDQVVITEDMTLYDISQEYGIQSHYLEKYNNRSKNQVIKSGTVILLKPGEVKIQKQEKTIVKSNPETFHVVESKDTLYRLSAKYGVTVQQLLDWNNLKNNNLQIGQKLIVSQ